MQKKYSKTKPDITIWNKIKNLFTNKPLVTTDPIPSVPSLTYNALSQENISMSTEELLSLSLFTSAIKLIANAIGKVNFTDLKHSTLTNTYEPDRSSTLVYLLNRRPNSYQSDVEFKRAIVYNLFIHGKAPVYVVQTKDSITKKNTIHEMLLIYPDWVRVQWDYTNKTARYFLDVQDPYEMTNQADYVPDNNERKEIELSAENIIYLTYDSIMGVSDSQYKNLFKSTLNKIKENEISLINSITNDVGLSLLIEVPELVNPEQQQALRNSVDAMFKTQKRNGSLVFVHDDRWKVTANKDLIGGKVDMSTRNAIGRELAATMGVPAHKLGIEDPNKYNSHVEQHKAFTDDALIPLLSSITKSFTNFFYKNNYLRRIDYSKLDLLSLDPISIQGFATSGINAGFLTQNEVRGILGFARKEGADILYMNSALVPTDAIVNKSNLDLELLKTQIKAAGEINVDKAFHEPTPQEVNKF